MLVPVSLPRLLSLLSVSLFAVSPGLNAFSVSVFSPPDRREPPAPAAPLRRAPPPPRPAPPRSARGHPVSARAWRRLSPHPAAGAMAGTTLRVAGRQLSQRSGSGVPILLRQVRGGWARSGTTGRWAAAGAGPRGPLKRRDPGSPGLGARLLSPLRKRLLETLIWGVFGSWDSLFQMEQIPDTKGEEGSGFSVSGS